MRHNINNSVIAFELPFPLFPNLREVVSTRGRFNYNTWRADLSGLQEGKKHHVVSFFYVVCLILVFHVYVLFKFEIAHGDPKFEKIEQVCLRCLIRALKKMRSGDIK